MFALKTRMWVIFPQHYVLRDRFLSSIAGGIDAGIGARRSVAAN